MNDIVGFPGQTAIEQISHPAPALFLHCALFLARNRLLGDETFRLTSIQGQESISEPFEYQLEVHANTSVRHGQPLKFDDVIGRAVTFGIQYPSAFSPAQMTRRFTEALKGAATGEELALFNGMVTAFSMEIPGVYRMTVKPMLWKLALTNAYAVHRQMNVVDTISKLLDRHRVSYSMEAIAGFDNPAIARIQDWLQAGETDLEFLRRMMNKAHLYYYFTHTGNTHRMVFANLPQTPYPWVFADRRPLRYTYTNVDELGLAQSDVISQYSYQRSLLSSGVRGVFTRQEAAWEEDAVAQFQTYQANSEDDLGELPFNRYKIYQYGCSSDEVQQFTASTQSAMESTGSQFSGHSYCAHFRVGHQFSVTSKEMADSHPMPVQPSLEGQRFVLTQVKHQASADGGYQNEFQATEAAGFIAAFSIQETQQGAILAKVVAKSGDMPSQDWRYYTANYFDPETNALVDNDAAVPNLNAMGVYVRFSTDSEDSAPVWVKLAPSMQTVPEIGVTVLVTRAQDESELPEIQTIIQANGGMTIMPSAWTANTHVGSSYSTNYGDSKSIRFGKNSVADLNNAIGIATVSYNTGKYRDTGYSQGASYNYATSEAGTGKPSSDSELFGPYAGATDLLSASESFGSTYNRQYATVSSSFSNIGTSYSKSTLGKSESYTTINGTSHSENTHFGDITSITTMNANSVNTTTQTGNTTNTNTITGTSTSANTNNGSVTSSTTVNGDSANTSVNNGDVSSTNTVTGISNTTSKIAVSNSNDAIGVSNRNAVTGIANNNSLTGVSANISLTGASSETSATAATSQMSAVAASLAIIAKLSALDVSYTQSANSVSMVDLMAKVDIQGPGIQFTSQGTTMKYDISGLDITLLSAIKMIM